MKVYFTTEGHDINDDTHIIKDSLQYYFSEMVRYKIMWYLRALEKDMQNENGMIVIRQKDIASRISVTATGFSQELCERINEIAQSVKL